MSISKRVLISLSLVVFSVCNAQNLLLIGEKAYNSTNFYSLGTGFLSDVRFCFAKDKNESLIVFENSFSRVQGELLIYLDNSEILKIQDNKKYDTYVKGSTEYFSSIYNLDNDALTRLKVSNINGIRCKRVYSDGSGNKDHIYYNKEKYLFGVKNERIDFIKEFSDFFN